MALGTNNRQAYIVFKDIIKEILFFLSSSKYARRSALMKEDDLEKKYLLCSQLIPIHQSKYEIIQLVKSIQAKQPEIMCEIGTADGGTGLFLASCLPGVKWLICIDLYVKNKNKISFFLKGKKTSFIQASSYSPATVNVVNKLLKNKKIDFLFIDGDHSYTGVSKDYHSYTPLVNKSGAIAFHDIIPDYNTRFSKDTGMWVGEVPKFWNEIKEKLHGQEIVENYEQDGQGIGLLNLT